MYIARRKQSGVSASMPTTSVRPKTSLATAVSAKSPQRRFTGSGALQVALPMGGIGAGCICLNGYGGLQDFSIRNKPALTATPDGHTNSDAAFALLHVKGKTPRTRMLEGPMPVE